jgi:hypothetical protein
MMCDNGTLVTCSQLLGTITRRFTHLAWNMLDLPLETSIYQSLDLPVYLKLLVKFCPDVVHSSPTAPSSRASL